MNVMPNAKQSISLCMIVRNEAESISQSLDSVKDFVDEIIVVDTGSEDQTVEIARSLGAKVFQRPWTGDFSEARNHSIGHATGDWILVLDADETISSRDAVQLEAIIQSPQSCGYSLIQRSYLWDSNVACSKANPQDYSEGARYHSCVDVNVIRLFRNIPEIRYQGRVHELVDPIFDKLALPFAKTELVIHHYGKVGNREKLSQKMRLYLELGRKKAAEHPDDALAQFELGSQLYEVHAFAEALPCFEAAYRLNPKIDMALLYLALGYRLLGDLKKSEKYFHMCLAASPQNDRVLMEYANLKRDQGQLKTAIKHYQKSLAVNPRNPLTFLEMGRAYLALGKLEKGFALMRKSLQLNPDNDSLHENFGRVALRHGNMQEAVTLAEDYMQRFPGNRPIPMVLAELYFKLQQFAKARYWAQRSLEGGADSNHVLLIKAHAETSLGNLAEAEATYRALVVRDPVNLDALMNLASLSEHFGRAVETESWLEKLLQHHPNHPLALKKYGLLLARKNPDQKALCLLNQAYEANPEDVECLLLLGHLLEKHHRPAEAAAIFRNAKAQNPKLARLANQKIARFEEQINAGSH